MTNSSYKLLLETQLLLMDSIFSMDAKLSIELRKQLNRQYSIIEETIKEIELEQRFKHMSMLQDETN